MTDFKLLCKHVRHSDVTAMKEFLQKNPDTTWINDHCNVDTLWLGGKVFAGIVFGSELPVLLFSVLKENIKMTRIILETATKLEMNATSQYGDTALMLAVLLGDVATSKLLVNSNKDIINMSDEHGFTALHKAALGKYFIELTGRKTDSKNYLKIAQFLIDSGVNIQAKAQAEGQSDGTAIDVATKEGYEDMAQLLLAAQEEAPDNQGDIFPNAGIGRPPPSHHSATQDNTILNCISKCCSNIFSATALALLTTTYYISLKFVSSDQTLSGINAIAPMLVAQGTYTIFTILNDNQCIGFEFI